MDSEILIFKYFLRMSQLQTSGDSCPGFQITYLLSE